MVSQSSKTTDTETPAAAIQERHPSASIQTEGSASSCPQTTVDGMQFIRESIKDVGISGEVTEILMSSWRKSTQKQYKGYIERWLKFSYDNQFDPSTPQICEVIEFLSMLFKSGLGYSCLNTARSAISSVLSLQSGTPLGTHPLVVRFMKGVFEERPSLPRYSSTWDVNVVLTYLKSLPANVDMSLKELTHKLASLLVILSGQRLQTIRLLDIKHMIEQDHKVIFQVKALVKQSKPGRHVDDMEFRAYTPNPKLCVVACIKEYIKRTSTIRGQETQLLLSWMKPHSSISQDTLS